MSRPPHPLRVLTSPLHLLPSPPPPVPSRLLSVQAWQRRRRRCRPRPQTEAACPVTRRASGGSHSS
jgi:hypothetical protein